MNQSKVVMSLFLKTNGQFTEAIMPGIRALHHPATGGMATRRVGFQLCFSTPTHMRTIASLANSFSDFLSIVAFIKTQMLRDDTGEERDV